MNSWAWKYFGHVPCFIAQALESVTDMFASVYALGKGSTMSKPVTRTAHCTLMISTWTMARLWPEELARLCLSKLILLVQVLKTG
jgi:hypothetical protein